MSVHSTLYTCSVTCDQSCTSTHNLLHVYTCTPSPSSPPHHHTTPSPHHPLTSVWLLLRAAPCCTQLVVEYSSRLSVAQRTANLRSFINHEAHVLICSDAMTRGMDVSDVANVINYDAPVYVKTYVHRAGRTARAGRGGRVVTLLRDEVCECGG